MKCPQCGSRKIRLVEGDTTTGKVIYKCEVCERIFKR